MRQKIVLRRRAVPLNITLPNGTSFVARYERIGRKNLPGNIGVTRTRTIGPRKRCTRKKKMSKQISKSQIENALKDMNDEGIDDNFVGVFPSNHINKFINHAAMISEKKGKYPFVIANTDSSEKGGIHWWSILDIEPKQEIFCYYSFGLNSLKNFTIQDNRNVIEKILLGTEKTTRTANKITFFNIWFNLNACKNLSTEELVQVFGNKLKLINFVNI